LDKKSLSGKRMSQYNRDIIKIKKMYESVFIIISLLSLLFSIVILMLLVFDLAKNGIPRINFDFFINFPSRFPEKAGILSAWVGSLCVMFTTAIMAIPLGIASAIYLEEYAPKNIITQWIELNIINLAAIPSITFGLMALGIFVYKMNLGQSILTAGLTLGMLVLPIIIVTTRESLKSIPKNLREAAYALGASRWQMIWDHLLPYSSGGIVTGVIIALSRAIGETAPLITIGALTFIAFLPSTPFSDQFPFVNFQWMSDPFTVMPIQMFNWVSRPQSEFHVNAAATGLILLLMTMFMNGFAIYIRYKFRKKYKW